eukprot:PhM_4_TR716/c0_g1_i1/m.91637
MSDPKSALLILCQRRMPHNRTSLVKYDTEQSEGGFVSVVAVSIFSPELRMKGDVCPSKKKAEQSAALYALQYCKASIAAEESGVSHDVTKPTVVADVANDVAAPTSVAAAALRSELNSIDQRIAELQQEREKLLGAINFIEHGSERVGNQKRGRDDDDDNG